MFHRHALSLSVGLTLATQALAAQGPLIRDLPLDVVYRAKSKLVIPTQSEPARLKLNLPSFPQRSGVLCLRFEAYLYTPRPAGWNPYLGVVLNDLPLSRYTTLGFARLLQRADLADTTLGPKPWWSVRAGLPVLLTFFGPGGDVLDARVKSQREEGYWYLLDVSDAAHLLRRGADNRIESEQPNALTFVNTCLRRYFRGRQQFPGMIIDHLVVGYLPPEHAERLRRAQMISYGPTAPGPTLRGDGFALHVSNAGGIGLTVAGESYYFAAEFSYPSDPKMKFNAFRPDRAAGESGWMPSVQRGPDGSVVVSARGARYRVTRSIRIDSGRVRVRDAIRNLTDAAVGLVVRNTMALPQPAAGDAWRLAGVQRDALLAGVAANPTLFAAQTRSSVGVVAEDDVFRLQLELLRRFNAFDFQTTHFGMRPRGTHTLEWTIYPSSDVEYFGFVNRVRRDWGVNYTIEGPFVFDGRVVPGREAKIYVFGPWLDYHHDGTLTRERYRARVAPTLAKLRAAQPDAVFMPKIETNLFTIVKSRIPGGKILPGSDRKTGRYGFVLNQEQSRVLQAALGPWADSVLRKPDGRIVVDTYYEGYHRNGSDLFNLLLYVREGNHRYNFFLDQIDFVMDELGFNGVYIDQFSMEGAFSRRDRFTYDGWDGFTVDLGAAGRAVCKRIDCNLVGAQARAKILRHIVAKGGKVVINGHSTVRETRGLPAYRFQEMENDPVNPLEYLHGKPPLFFWQARGHLDSPIILGLRPVRRGEQGKRHWAEMIVKGVITALRNGQLYYYYASVIPTDGPGAGAYGPVNHMFPFTPVELHEGWLVGKERVITCVSRAFEWPRADRPRCLLFDLRGREKPHAFALTRAGAGWRVAVKLDDWNEIAVIEEGTAR